MTASNDALLSYLRTMVQMREAHLPSMGARFLCTEDYVLKKGVVFESQPLSADEDAYVRSLVRAYGGGSRLRIKQCFYNSMMLLTRDREDRLTYVEGFAQGRVMPVAHGWLMIGDGKVVDVTLRHPKRGRAALCDRVLGTWDDERAYAGVPFPREYIMRSMVERGIAGSVIDDWERGWPLLTGVETPV